MGNIDDILKNIRMEDCVELFIRTRHLMHEGAYCWKDEIGYVIGINRKGIMLARKKVFHNTVDRGLIRKYRGIRYYPLKKIISITKLETGEEYKLREFGEDRKEKLQKGMG